MFEPNRMKDVHLIEAYEILVSPNENCTDFAKKRKFFIAKESRIVEEEESL